LSTTAMISSTNPSRTTVALSEEIVGAAA